MKIKYVTFSAAELCKGKLVNAWGLGGLCNAHSRPGAHLSLSIRK